MENKYLAQILPFLNEIEEERRKQFEEYFRTAPMWLMDTFVVEELEKGTIFVQEGEPADTIFLIGKGLIKATDYRIYGINYDFTVFDKVYAFGGMEVIINLDKYQTTLQTVTKCTVLKIPKEGFKKWMDSDIRALQQESRLMGEYLLEHFSLFTDEEKTGALDYELEYILEGKPSDRENLEGVVKKLMLIRFVPNYAYIQTDATMKAEAEAMALTLCSLLAVPAITAAAAQVILLAWAYGETVMDLRSLLAGSRVPLVKTKDSWQLSLSSLLKLGTEEDLSDGKDTEGGLPYREYLRMLLFLKPQGEMALRTLGMIEQNLRKEEGLTWFRADLCISRVEFRSQVSLRRGIRYDFSTYFGYQ